MKYQIIGQNRESGARMTLEFEAESKAAAERKATLQGMSVHRVVDISDGHGAMSQAPDPRAGVIYQSGGGKLKKVILILIVLAVAWYFRGWIMRRL
jgi:hypothetical protein